MLHYLLVTRRLSWLLVWSVSFPNAEKSSLPFSENCQPHHRCWFIPLIIHKVACSLLCWPDASPHCQSMSAARCTGHVTAAGVRHKYFRKYILKQPMERSAHLRELPCFSGHPLFFLKVGARWRNMPSRQETHMSPCSSDCCSLMSMADGESFQSKLLKTSGQAFSLMQLKCPSRWRWHGNL